MQAEALAADSVEAGKARAVRERADRVRRLAAGEAVSGATVEEWADATTRVAEALEEARRDELLAAAEELAGALADRQSTAVARAEAAVGPRAWTRIARALESVVEGLEDLQDAHHARKDQMALRAAFGLAPDEPIEEPPALGLAVREKLQELERRIAKVFGACDRTVRIGSGRVPHHASDEVRDLLRRREELITDE